MNQRDNHKLEIRDREKKALSIISKLNDEELKMVEMFATGVHAYGEREREDEKTA